MDCQQAQAFFELDTLGQTAQGTEIHAARQHMTDCDACHTAFAAQERFDLEISRSMKDVPIPHGLTERLQAAIQSAAQAERATPATQPQKFSRQYWLNRRTVLGAIAVLLPILAICFSQRVSPLAESDVRHLAELDLNILPTTTTPFQFPSGWQSIRSIRFSDASRVVAEHRANIPLMSLMVRTNHRSPPVAGFLVRLPLSQWRYAPQADSFATAAVQYSSFGTWVVWREGNGIYVCVIRDNTQAMERLQHLVAGGRELT